MNSTVEKMLIEKKTQELKIALHALIEEIKALAENTTELSEEIEIVTMQAPVEPGVYHVIFFEKLLEFIKSFRKKIEDASIWLHASNKRAAKMNFWGKYKKHGGKFLLLRRSSCHDKPPFLYVSRKVPPESIRRKCDRYEVSMNSHTHCRVEVHNCRQAFFRA